MVGIVLVSHSSKIAEGIIELCSQMAPDYDKLINCSGIEDGLIGTDTLKIVEGIKEADDGDGVIIIMDIGSSIISTEMALDFLDENLRSRTLLVDTPIVEGALNASIDASIGGDLQSVKDACEGAKSLNKF